MATKLKNLKIHKVDFVDEGANPDAHIMLFKSKECESGGDPENKKVDPEECEGTGSEEDTEKGCKQKKSLAKRLMDLLTEIVSGGAKITDEEIDELETIEKSGATSFKENFNRRQRGKIFDEIWNVCYSLNDSLCSIIADEEVDGTEAASQMNQSVDDFSDCIKQCIQNWIAGTTSNVIMKSADLTKQQIETMKAARDRMDEIIQKSAEEPAGMEPENTAQSKGEKDMKFDKSKMTPAERAMLEEFEKKYGSEEQAATNPEDGVAKAAPKAQEATVEAPEADDIYKGMSPEAKAEIEALKKFREETEDKELRAIAKSYEIIGKKEDELFPVLKSLKATSVDAYNQMIDTLNQAKTSVEKSGAFTEIGKSGNGSSETDVWAMADAKATELMKSKTGITKNQALQEVFESDPELARKCKEEA